MLLDRGGTINNVEEALAITKAAYDEVNATIPQDEASRPSDSPTAERKWSNTIGPPRTVDALRGGIARARKSAERRGPTPERG